MKKLNFTIIILMAILFTNCIIDGDNNSLVVPFSKDNILWGLIQVNGEVVTPPTWREIPSIVSDDITRVKNKAGQYEYYTAEINPKQIGGPYKQATLFSDGIAVVADDNGKIQYINTLGEIIIDFTEDNSDNKVIKAGLFSEGLARFQIESGLWGFIDMSGVVVILPIYSYVENFSEGIALVEKYDEDQKITTRGFIDNIENEIIPLTDRYVRLKSFKNGYAAFTDKEEQDEWGFLNINGEEEIKKNPNWKEVNDFRLGVAPFFDGDAWGLIDNFGDNVIPASYSEEIIYYWNNLCPYIENGKIGFMDLNRKTQIKPRYNEFLPFFEDNTIVKEKFYQFIDINGERITDIYLKYVPVNSISNQYLNFRNELIRNSYTSGSGIARSIVEKVSTYSINNLSFNTNISSFMRSFNLNNEDLPRNNYQKKLRFPVPNIQGLECQVSAEFEYPVQKGSLENLTINDNSKLVELVYRININELDETLKQGITKAFSDIFENAGYSKQELGIDSGIEIFTNNNTIVKIQEGSNVFTLTIDYSRYF